jgi:hypothetical protein
MDTVRNKFYVAQLGARRHYAVPKILYSEGILDRFYTDFYTAGRSMQLFTWVARCINDSLYQRIAARCSPDLPDSKIRAFPIIGLLYAAKLRLARSPAQVERAILWTATRFSRAVLKEERGSNSMPYTFNGVGLELLMRARTAGRTGIIEQTIAPGAVERRLLNEALVDHAMWAEGTSIEQGWPSVDRRVYQEWNEASAIICGSEFVRQSIVECGGPEEKCLIVPSGVGRAFERRFPKAPHGGRLRVLTVGTVSLRKGAHLIHKIATNTNNHAEFRVVGTIDLPSRAHKLLRSVVNCVGSVPRSKIQHHYEWADVFLLPSLCEGSALVTYEAMAMGLPVLCTVNAGSPVEHGKNGFVVPLNEVMLLAQWIQTLSKERALLRAMSKCALESQHLYSFESYTKRLLKAVDCALAIKRGSPGRKI